MMRIAGVVIAVTLILSESEVIRAQPSVGTSQVALGAESGFTAFDKLCGTGERLISFFRVNGDDKTSVFRIWVMSRPAPSPKDAAAQASDSTKRILIFDWSANGLHELAAARLRTDCVVLDDAWADRLLLELLKNCGDDGCERSHYRNIGPAENNLWSFIDACLTLGESARGASVDLAVGQVRCHDGSRRTKTDSDSLFLVARVGDAHMLLGSRLSRALRVIYCEPRGVDFDEITYFTFANLMKRRNAKSPEPDELNNVVIGREGFFADEGSGAATCYFTDRSDFRRELARNLSLPVPLPDWVSTCSGCQTARRLSVENRMLFGGLSVCSREAWQGEFQLPVDPEIVLFPKDGN